MLKIGLIGCGGIGAIHARCWLNMGEDVKLTAIADNNVARAKEFADTCGANVYANGLDLLETEKVDVIDICLPTFLHTEYAVKAMEYVKHVIIEKPACLTEEEADCLLEMQKKTGALVQVAHVVRFMDAYRYLKELVNSGKYGKVVAGSFSRISPRPVWMKGHDDINRTGSMALDMHIHDADYIRYLMESEPDKTDSWAAKDCNGTIQHIWTSYYFGSAVLTAEASWDYPVGLPFAQTYRVKLEKAAAVLDVNGTVTLYTDDGDKFVPELSAREDMDLGINVSDLGPYMNEIRYFTENIRQGNMNGIASLSEAITSCRTVWKEIDSLKQP